MQEIKNENKIIKQKLIGVFLTREVIKNNEKFLEPIKPEIKNPYSKSVDKSKLARYTYLLTEEGKQYFKIERYGFKPIYACLNELSSDDEGSYIIEPEKQKEGGVLNE